MAKNTKTQTTTQGDPITDFFTPASKPHPQSSTGSRMRISSSIPSLAQASSSGDIRPTGTSETILTNDLKIESKMEETSETYFQELEVCSK